MIHRILSHLRGQWIGVIALFIALGGTSYAAVSIPRNSVGTKQLRNGAVTPKKLSAKSFGGHILMTAVVNASGHVVSSKPRGASTPHWTNLPQGESGWIEWHRPIPKDCFALASLLGPRQPRPGDQLPTTQTLFGGTRQAAVAIAGPGSTSYQVAVVCP